MSYLVHVHHPLNHVGLSGVLDGLSLPPDRGEGDVGWEEEEEAEEGEEGDDDGGQIEASVGSVGRGRVGGVGSTVGLCRSTVGVGLRGSVALISPDSGSESERCEEESGSNVTQHDVGVRAGAGLSGGEGGSSRYTRTGHSALLTPEEQSTDLRPQTPPPLPALSEHNNTRLYLLDNNNNLYNNNN